MWLRPTSAALNTLNTYVVQASTSLVQDVQ
jgi:hypothetical protein